jgi:hypothetical protein
MRSFTEHPISLLHRLAVFFATTTISLAACEDLSAIQESPAQPATEAQTTSERAAKRDTETPIDESDLAADDDAIDFEESPHLDNKQTITIEAKWKRLGRNQIWINHEDKQVMVRGRICLQEGPLEMFACPGTTKAHESVIASEAKASEIHASLEALGFPPGKPVQWDPKYTPAEGPLVKILVGWQEGDKFKQVNARNMVKVSGTDKPLEKDWVFGGSQIYHDNVSGEKIYYADSGEMVCLSNFSTAMLDVQIESSDSADGLLFEANKEKIPPPNTKVYMIFVPRKAETKPADSAPRGVEMENGQSPDK